ncbi:MAG TPA: nitroreductase family protein, partial [Anaerovoracaceae bacterium]|nr:nitroreductase family protein [Anaerovoracaceae bacterium]
MKSYEHKPLSSYQSYPLEKMMERAVSFRQEMQRRRTIRHFSKQDVPREIIEECLLAAGTAPNGANLQPWQFVVVS